MFHFISQEVDDAIQYLADLDRVYSEHVRPRCGKIEETNFFMIITNQVRQEGAGGGHGGWGEAEQRRLP